MSSTKNSVEEADVLEPPSPAAAWFIGLGAVALYVGANAFYWLFRLWAAPDFKEAEWGQYGDFIGGLTNPALTLLTFGALLLANIQQQRIINIQLAELKLQRRELALTNEALSGSKQIADKQLCHIQNEAEKLELRNTLNVIDSEIERIIASTDNHHRFTDIFDVNLGRLRHVIKDGHQIKYRELQLGRMSRMKDLIESMNAILSDYINKIGDIHLAAYYVMKYREYAYCFNEVGYSNSENLSIFFKMGIKSEESTQHSSAEACQQ